ncbi:coiled-coil domain-containing protein 28A-like isoform X3 [Uranotaenia lowii]|uniref:coiled-coil domain-containing protein 28A-like isoform X3 n=1 Tax=Uranotaenia lowii TaxID=190385 RepID=UPI002478D29E|nr:coiled-coil domain-containing protein 28A-like isoform X3 [Uranotaenia lowii]
MECDDAAVERQKLVSNDEEDDQATITNLSSSGQAKSIQTPISPVLSNKIFSSSDTSRSHNSTSYPASVGKVNNQSSDGPPAARLNYVNERKNQEAPKAKPKKIQRDLTPNSEISSSNSSSFPLSSRRNMHNLSSDHSLLASSSSSRQHSNAATANSSSISLNKSHSFTSRPLKHHSFISEVPDVRHMERALLGLLEDFHSGKLKAFGSGCTMEQMTSIREQQESLAKLHFDLGNECSLSNNTGTNNEAQSQNNMKKLVNKLEQLSFSIEKLHSSKVEP